MYKVYKNTLPYEEDTTIKLFIRIAGTHKDGVTHAFAYTHNFLN